MYTRLASDKNMLFSNLRNTVLAKHLLFLSDPSPIIGYACHSLTHSLTDSCLVELMAVNDTNCLMMSQQLLKALKSFPRLKKVVHLTGNH